jgi:hypothetical protein
MRESRFRRLKTLGFVLAGSLVRFPKHNGLYLTDKVQGKTRTLYIPLDRMKEVSQWNASFREAKKLLTELSEIQRQLLRGEIAQKHS